MTDCDVKDEQSLSYTPAVLLDIRGDKYLVDMGEGQVWVNWALVRETPGACAEFVPEVVRAEMADARAPQLCCEVGRPLGAGPFSAPAMHVTSPPLLWPIRRRALLLCLTPGRGVRRRTRSSRPGSRVASPGSRPVSSPSRGASRSPPIWVAD